MVAGIVAIVSLFLPFWTYSLSIPATSTNVAETMSMDFSPGANAFVTITENGQTESLTTAYNGQIMGLNSTAVLYNAVQYMLVFALIAGLIGGILGIVAMTGINALERRYMIFVLLGIVTVALAVMSPVLVMAEQPGDINADTHIPTSEASVNAGSILRLTSPSPATSFWGLSNCNYLGNCSDFTASWGAGSGWYLSFASAGIAAIGTAFLVAGRPKREQLADETQSSNYGYPAGPAYAPQSPYAYQQGYGYPQGGPLPQAPTGYPVAGYPAGPSSQPSYQIEQGPVCPACGTQNPPGARMCGRCALALR
jgi:hypothetical protein